MPNIQIEALDTLFFRDGKPFSMGDDTMATGIFPPPPSVFYGALRTLYFSDNLDDLSKANMPEDPTAKLQINNIFLSDSATILLPLPNDIVVVKQRRDVTTKLLSLIDKPTLSNATTAKMLGLLKHEKVEEDNFVMDSSIFLDFYAQGDAGFVPTKLSNYLTTETKIGIARNSDKKTTEDGRLYRLQHQRLEGKFEVDKPNKPKRLYFHVDYDLLDVPNQSHVVMLGGERKLIQAQATDAISIACPTITNSIFKIYLATDAIFASGWQPAELLKKHHLELITCALGKYKNIGGFDVKAKRPKQMYKCVPAGSVYYVKAQSVEQANELAQIIHNTCISDIQTPNFNAAQQGFGLALVANFNPQNQ